MIFPLAWLARMVALALPLTALIFASGFVAARNLPPEIEAELLFRGYSLGQKFTPVIIFGTLVVFIVSCFKAMQWFSSVHDRRNEQRTGTPHVPLKTPVKEIVFVGIVLFQISMWFIPLASAPGILSFAVFVSLVSLFYVVGWWVFFARRFLPRVWARLRATRANSDGQFLLRVWERLRATAIYNHTKVTMKRKTKYIIGTVAIAILIASAGAYVLNSFNEKEEKENTQIAMSLVGCVQQLSDAKAAQVLASHELIKGLEENAYMIYITTANLLETAKKTYNSCKKTQETLTNAASRGNSGAIEMLDVWQKEGVLTTISQMEKIIKKVEGQVQQLKIEVQKSQY